MNFNKQLTYKEILSLTTALETGSVYRDHAVYNALKSGWVPPAIISNFKETVEAYKKVKWK